MSIYKNTRLVKALPFHCILEGNEYNVVHIDIVERAFQLRLEGLGAPTIAKRLNEEFSPPLKIRSGSFSQHFVHKLLKDKSSIGTLTLRTGEEIKGYFPPAVSETIYNKVNSENNFTTGIIKNDSGSMNVLKGISHCVYCKGGVVARVSNSRFRTLNCVNKAKGCPSQGSLQMANLLPAILNCTLKDQWTKEAFSNADRSQRTLDEYTAKIEAVQKNLQHIQSKETIEQLEGDIQEFKLYLTFHAELLKGNKDNLLQVFDLTTLEGKRSFSILMSAIYKDILIDFEEGIVTLIHNHNQNIQKIKTTHEKLNPEVWKVKGIKTILFKNPNNIPDEYVKLKIN
ncbi:putative Recombinase domain-containing protein [Vibrio crassostreae]|nr:putative Recombinase domain-containing protein [Vibrio crassostreae]